LEETGILNMLAQELASERVPLHKAACRLRELYNGGHSQAFYEGHAAEGRRRAIESRYGANLETVRETAYAEPPIDWSNKKDPKPIPSQYLGSDNVGVAGPLRVDAEVAGPDGSVTDSSYSIDAMVPLSPCRPGIVDGVSYGIKMTNSLRNYGESGHVRVKVENISRTTRSPTIKFYSEEDVIRAIKAFSEEELKRHMMDIGNELMRPYQGQVGNITLSSKEINSHYELSINFIYHMFGDYMGHEAATFNTGQILRDVILPKLYSERLNHKRLCLAGGQDLDMKPSPHNVRGRRVIARVFLPKEYLENEFADKKTGRQGITPEEFEELNISKHWEWPEYSGSLMHTGMEPEVLSSIYSAINPPSTPHVSSMIDVRAQAVREPREGVLYTVAAKNLEWGIEGIRTPVRTELESVIGVDGKKPDPNGRNSIRAAAIIVAACLPAGLNQHRLAYLEKLADTKKHT